MQNHSTLGFLHKGVCKLVLVLITCGDGWKTVCWRPVWPDLAFFCTLGNHSKLVTTIILPKSPTLLANFCIGVKIIHFSSEFIFEIFYRLLAIFIWSHWKWVLSNFSYNRPPWHQNLRTFYDIKLLRNSYI